MSTSWEKMARKLLLNPYGREALKKFGIDVEVVSEVDEKKQDDKPIVAVLCPTYRAPEPQMRDALTKAVQYTHAQGVATLYSGPPLQTSCVHWSRNGLVAEQLNSGKPWTHVLFIDDDIVVAEDDIVKLLSHNKDIIAGLCTRRSDPPVPNIRAFDADRSTLRQIWEWPDKQLIEVDAVGTGLMLISRTALEQVAQVYFDCLWEQEFYGLAGPRLEELKRQRLDAFDATKNAYWFRFLPSLGTSTEMGEDMSFCYLAKRYAELGVFVDTSVLPGHIGNYPYSIRDFLPYRNECVLRAKVNGEYAMEVPDMKISILVPTRGRPENMKRLVASLMETSTQVPEIVFYVDEDDEAGLGCLETLEKSGCVRSVVGPRILMSKMWNRCLEASTGEILMMGGDDLVFKTKGWDDKVRRAFAAFPDRLVFVHGDDGVYQEKFGTHGFLHRNWVEAVGYLCPPHYASDFNDTHINEVANALNRRIYLPFVTEHMHPLAGKAAWDQTHKERLERQKEQNTEALYKSNAWERERDAEILRKAIADYGKSVPARQPELALIQSA